MKPISQQEEIPDNSVQLADLNVDLQAEKVVEPEKAIPELKEQKEVANGDPIDKAYQMKTAAQMSSMTNRSSVTSLKISKKRLGRQSSRSS